MIRRVKALPTAWLVLGLWATPMSGSASGRGAQEPIRGLVVSSDGLALSGVQIRLAVAPASGMPAGPLPTPVETDENGRFLMPRPPAGELVLVARRIGYRPDSLRVGAGTINVTLRLDRIAQGLETVRVVGRRDITGPMAGFYRRMQTGGGGRFLTLADIERRNPMQMTDVLRMIPGIRIEGRGFVNQVRMRGNRCAPLVWLDGSPMSAGEVDLDAWDPRSFEGIEIYSGAATVPVEFQGSQRMNSACGTIVLWSRRGEPRERRRKKGDPTPTERIARLLDERKAYLPDEVDRAAILDSTSLVRPVYPDSLHDARTAGRVIAEFVVGHNGRVMMETFSAVSTSHLLFVEPVRRAVLVQEFTPAMRRGTAVAQVLQWTYEFVPDSVAIRR